MLHLHALHARLRPSPLQSEEILSSTLATIHNEWFTLRLVDAIRASIEDGCFEEFRSDMLGRYQAGRRP